MFLTAARAVRWCRASFDAVLFEHVLTDLPEPDVIEGVTLRLASAADEPALAGLWAPYRQAAKVAEFRQRFADGCMCFAAFREDRIDAITWAGQRDSYGRVEARPESLVGIDLYRREGEGGRGIGRALLSYSSIVARDAGYTRKVAYVEQSNAPMLATMRPLGYVKIGTAKRRTTLGRTRWSWKIGDETGRASWLTL